MQKLDSLLKKIGFYEYYEQQTSVSAMLHAKWSIIFEDLADDVIFESYRKNTLKLNVRESVIKQELLNNKQELLDKIERCLPNLVVKSIAIM